MNSWGTVSPSMTPVTVFPSAMTSPNISTVISGVMPTMATVPSGRSAARLWWTTAGTPVVSTAKWVPEPVAFLTSSTTSTSLLLSA